MAQPNNIALESAAKRSTNSLSLKELSKHLAALPRANSASALQEILGLIHSYNFSTLNAKDALDTLTLFSQHYKDLEKQLLNEQTLTGLSGTQQCLPVIKLLETLIQKIEYGFKQIISISQDKTSKRSLSDDDLAACVCFSIQILTDSLRNAYCVYKEEPLNLWGKLHTLYALAEQQDLQTRPVKLSPGHVSHACTLYKTALVLAISKPYQVAPGEVVKLSRVLATIVPDVLLEKTKTKGLSCHYVDLNSNHGPQYGRKTEAASVRVLGFDKARVRLNQELKQLGAKLGSPTQNRGATQVAHNISNRIMKFELGLVERRMRGWIRRRDERKSANALVSFALGVAGSHNVLSGNQPFEPEKDLVKILGESKDSSGGFSLIPDQQRDLPEDLDLPPLSITDTQSFAIQSGILRDWSKQGMRIEQSQNELSWNVGDLLAFRLNHSKDEKWIIGCTRWKKIHGAKIMELGVVYMGGRVTPVACRKEHQDSNNPFFRSLLLPGETPSLITPSGIFQGTEELTLVGNGGVLKIRLAEALRSSPTFSQYRIVSER